MREIKLEVSKKSNDFLLKQKARYYELKEKLVSGAGLSEVEENEISIITLNFATLAMSLFASGEKKTAQEMPVYPYQEKGNIH
ncbi:hypothetical protein [uncultured Microbulbifer sp.]|uniref:hypothetical protein n=1 Tax=uncultured Microbulbifer sp. TaxID=348147 RepID=UPI002634F9A4|nr:hypothetical protein [uncultured Microbulbifer sp.]